MNIDERYQLSIKIRKHLRGNDAFNCQHIKMDQSIEQHTGDATVLPFNVRMFFSSNKVLTIIRETQVV